MISPSNAEEKETDRQGKSLAGCWRPADLPPPRNRIPVTKAEKMWMSHSQTPTRTLPNTPLPSTLTRNTGLELLQKASSRSASPAVRRPCR